MLLLTVTWRFDNLCGSHLQLFLLQLFLLCSVEKSVTSRNQGSTISGSQSFLAETAIWIVEGWKKSMGFVLFLMGNHAQESHTCQFFPFLQDHGVLKPRNIATMATWRNNLSLFTSKLLTADKSRSSMSFLLNSSSSLVSGVTLKMSPNGVLAEHISRV